MAGHALVGCGSAIASGGACGPGALSGAVGSFVGPMVENAGFFAGLAITSTAGGLASVAGGGKFGNGAVTAAYGYLFNQMARKRPPPTNGPNPIDTGITAAVTTIVGFLTDLGSAQQELLRAAMSGKYSGDYPRDYQTKNTEQLNAYFGSEGEARNVARQKVGSDPVDLGDNKLRSEDGRWQYRAKPGDVEQYHVHLKNSIQRLGKCFKTGILDGLLERDDDQTRAVKNLHQTPDVRRRDIGNYSDNRSSRP